MTSWSCITAWRDRPAPSCCNHCREVGRRAVFSWCQVQL